jgi:hypothetical protein
MVFSHNSAALISRGRQASTTIIVDWPYLLMNSPSTCAGILNSVSRHIIPASTVASLVSAPRLTKILTEAASWGPYLPSRSQLASLHNVSKSASPSRSPSEPREENRELAELSSHLLTHGEWTIHIDNALQLKVVQDFVADPEDEELQLDFGTLPTSYSGQQLAGQSFNCAALGKDVIVKASTTGPFTVAGIAAQSGVWSPKVTYINGVPIPGFEQSYDEQGTFSGTNWSIELKAFQKFSVGIRPSFLTSALPLKDGVFTGALTLESEHTTIIVKLTVTVSSANLGLFDLWPSKGLFEFLSDTTGVLSLGYRNWGEGTNIVIQEYAGEGLHVASQDIPTPWGSGTIMVPVTATPSAKRDEVIPFHLSYTVFEGKEARGCDARAKVHEPMYVHDWTGELRDKVICHQWALLNKDGFVHWKAHIYDSSDVSGDQGLVGYMLANDTTKPEFADTFPALTSVDFKTGSTIAGPPKNWDHEEQRVWPKVASTYIQCVDHGGLLFFGDASTEWATVIGEGVELITSKVWEELLGITPPHSDT